MTRYLYLATILVSAAGVLILDRRFRLGAFGPRLFRAGAITVPAFLAIDAVGASRGWFLSDRRLSVAIVPPGISLEEPFLLAFLVLVSIALWRGANRLAGRPSEPAS